MVNVATLGEQLRGQVVTAGDAMYEDARKVYNAMHDRRPEAVVEAVDETDVIAAVRFARDNDLELAVRGGGHSVPGYGTTDGGLVIDLGRIRHALVDPEDQTVRMGGGSLLGDMRPRDLYLRSGHSRRVQLDHRGRRADPGWRDRPIPEPQVRPHLRQL